MTELQKRQAERIYAFMLRAMYAGDYRAPLINFFAIEYAYFVLGCDHD